MTTTLRFRRRAVGGAAGAPSSLRTAEPAYNMQDGVLYIGFGDDGGGNATTVRRFGADNFIANVPAGGTTGQALVKSSNADGAWTWQTISAGGGTYTASGDGIELTANNFSLNYTEIATGLALSTTYAPINHTHDAAAITSGVLAVARIPNLDASRINSGTFDAARIPNLDASRIATGVLDIARIPVLPGNRTIVSSGAISALTLGQQNDIAEGTIVTTTDGRRWVYSGTGSKTLEASYIEMADITPEWSAVANKPVFALVATSGNYNDLTNRPTLGTLAAQNANSVNITGGSITNIIMDGGTF